MKLKDILHLFTVGQRKFVESCFQEQMDIEIYDGDNSINNPKNLDTLEFSYDHESGKVYNVEGTETATAYHTVEFDGDDYYHGEI